MFKQTAPRIIASSVIAMIAVAAVLTFTRGESPVTDTASATLPGVSGTTGPVVESSTTKPKPKPSSPASADAAEREAENADSKGTTKVPAKSPTQNSGPTSSPTSSPTKSPTTAPPKAPEPEPQPQPEPTRPCGLLGAILGTCK